MTKPAHIALFMVVFSAVLFVFLYRLDYTALLSYDEAWYAEITRNLVQNGNPLHLTFNGMTFNDHPPFGFILMAVPTLILGSNELSARLASAILGAANIVLIYLTGKELKGRSAGISAAAILLSCLWFMLRARSGNLDIPFLFWSLFTFYMLIRSQKNVRFFYWSSLGFAAMFLTKTLVGIGILPVFLFALWLKRHDLNRRMVFTTLLLILVAILPWYIYNQYLDPGFLQHHFLEVGTRSSGDGFSFAALQKSMFYLQVGVGKWLKLFLISAPVAILLWIFKKDSRKALSLVSIYVLGFAPFFFSGSVEVWHLIPAYPGIALLIAIVAYEMTRLIFPKFKNGVWMTTVTILLIATFQFNQMSNLLYPIEPQISAERNISRSAAGYSQVYLFETFYPAAVYYSGTKIIPMNSSPQAYQEMTTILKQKSGPVIVNEQNIKDLGADEVPYRVIDRYENYFLLE